VTEAHLGDALSALLDGELSADEAAAARAHLGQCRRCADELAGVDAVRRRVRGLPPVDPRAVVSLPRRRTPLFPAAAAAAALVLLVAWTPIGGPVRPPVAAFAATAAPAGDPSSRSRVHVEWVDRVGTHTTEMNMAPTWAPAVMAPKYQVENGPVEAVAGRLAVDVSLREQGALVEQLALDSQTGRVLRRAEFDGSGHRVRLVEVERADAAAQPVSTTVPGLGPVDTVPKLAAPFRARMVLDGGYRRQAVYAWDQVVDAVYSDGMHTLSVFAQAGRLSGVELPAGADTWSLGTAGPRARHFRWPGGEVMVWQAGGVVYTAVGDAPAEDLRKAAASIPGGRSLSATARLRRTSRAMAETLLGS
jgi:anti-sigma factor RsiW